MSTFLTLVIICFTLLFKDFIVAVKRTPKLNLESSFKIQSRHRKFKRTHINVVQKQS